MCLLRSHCGTSIKWTPLVHDKCLLYGDVHFIESPSKNQVFESKHEINICHNFPSPDLLEGLKDKHLKENAKLFSFAGFQTRFTTLVHLTTDHELITHL